MLTLQEAVNVDTKRVGNKFKRLAELNAAGRPVKPAVIIESGEVASLLRHPRKTLLADLEKVFLRQGIINIPNQLFAVRSSAFGEDGKRAWPGVLRTKLWVKFEDLREVVYYCAQALTSPEAKAYGSLHGMELLYLALGVQLMADAEVAGVLFTTNPLIPQNGTMVLEAAPGVAEKLVSGQIEPRRYYLDARNGHVLHSEGSCVELSAYQIRRVYEEGCAVKGIYGDQDIEWAMEPGCSIFVNQSRDLTGSDANGNGHAPENQLLAREIRHVDQTLKVEGQRLRKLGLALGSEFLSDQNIAELLTPHPTAMGFGLFTYCFAHGNGGIRRGRNELGYDIGEELDQGFFHLVAGQPRCGIIHDALSYRIKGIPLSDYCLLINYYLERVAGDYKLANYPEVVLYNQNPSEEFLSQFFGAEAGTAYRQAYDRFFTGIREAESSLFMDCCDNFLPAWQELLSPYAKADLSVLNLEQLVRQYRQVCDLLRDQACTTFVKVARLGFFAYARLRNLLADLFPEDAEQYLNTLTGGIPIEFNPNLRFSIDLARLRDSETTLGRIVEDYGHLGSHELEISVPRYRDQPEILLQLAQKITGDPGHDLQESQTKSANLRQRLAILAGPSAELLDQEIESARRYLPLREVVKFYYLQGYDVLRRISIETGRRLDWEQGLIFYLDPKEVFELADQFASLQSIARFRQIEREMFKSVFVPAVIQASHLEVIGRDSSIICNGCLSGIGVTNLVTEGEVVVVTSLEDREAFALLRSGSILVTVTTDPAWSPMLSVIGSTGGLVTEIGGLLAHGAIYAREMGIAAVLNVPSATKHLQTGMRVRVNGPAGKVEIL